MEKENKNKLSKIKKFLKKVRYSAVILIALVIAGVSWIGYKNPEIFRAAITEVSPPASSTANLYIPVYKASPGDTGNIAIKTQNVTTAENLYSVKFKLKYSPSTALAFDDASLVFDKDTLFKKADLKSVTTTTAGEVIFSFFSGDKVNIPTDSSSSSDDNTLVKLSTKVSGSVGQNIDLTVDGIEVVAEDTTTGAAFPYKVSSQFTKIDAGQIKLVAVSSNNDQTTKNVSASSITPASITNDADKTVVILGNNLDQISKIYIGSTAGTIKSKTATTLNFTVPKGLTAGKYNIKYTDDNSSNSQDLKIGSTNLSLNVTADTTTGTANSAPKIVSTKSYTSPKTATNDGKTSITLYAFVTDPDNDVDTVVVNLSKIGQVGTQTSSDFKQVDDSGSSSGTTTIKCPTESKTIVCMKPSFKEGNGQWFVLSDVTIATTTKASSTAYKVDVVATDKTSKTDQGDIPILVQDSNGKTVDQTKPVVLSVVPTGSDKLEVVFNEEIATSVLSSDGSDFTITEKNNSDKNLAITAASLSSDANVVTLTTNTQTADKEYVLSVSKNITDKASNAVDDSKTYAFKGYTAIQAAPAVYYVSAINDSSIELAFKNSLLPSSIKLGSTNNTSGGNFDVEIMENGTSNKLPIYSVQFLPGSQNALAIKTAKQKPGKIYTIQIKNINSADGTQLQSNLYQAFKSIDMKAVQSSAVKHQADFNGDSKIDFADFTIFSAAYGKDISK